MGKVIPLFGKKSPETPVPTTVEATATYAEACILAGTPVFRDSVLVTINDLLQRRRTFDRKMGSIPRVEYSYSSSDPRPFGVLCMPLHTRIVGNNVFLEFLGEQTESREQTLSLSAAYMGGLSFWHGLNEQLGSVPGRKGYFKKTVTGESQSLRLPNMWTPEASILGAQTVNTALQRCAAAVALKHVGLTDIDTSEQPPYPAHVAALVDPMPAENLLIIFRAMTATI